MGVYHKSWDTVGHEKWWLFVVNTGVATKTSPRTGSGSGVEVSPAHRSSGIQAPGLQPAFCPSHRALPDRPIKRTTSIPQESSCFLRPVVGMSLQERWLGTNYHWPEQAQDFNAHAPEQGFHTLKASWGRTNLWGACACTG